MLRAGVLEGGPRLPRLPRLEVHARGLPVAGRALGRVAHGFWGDGEMHCPVLHVRCVTQLNFNVELEPRRQGRAPPLRLPDL